MLFGPCFACDFMQGRNQRFESGGTYFDGGSGGPPPKNVKDVDAISRILVHFTIVFRFKMI